MISGRFLRNTLYIFRRACMRACVSKIKDKILEPNSSHQNIKKVHINISTNLLLLRYNSKYLLLQFYLQSERYPYRSLSNLSIYLICDYIFLY